MQEAEAACWGSAITCRLSCCLPHRASDAQRRNQGRGAWTGDLCEPKSNGAHTAHSFFPALVIHSTTEHPFWTRHCGRYHSGDERDGETAVFSLKEFPNSFLGQATSHIYVPVSSTIK